MRIFRRTDWPRRWRRLPDSARRRLYIESNVAGIEWVSHGCRSAGDGLRRTHFMSGSRRTRRRQVKRTPALTAADIQRAFRYGGLTQPRRSPFERGGLRQLSRRPCDCSPTRAVISPSADGVSGVMASRSRGGCQGLTAKKALELAASERRLLLYGRLGFCPAKDNSGVNPIRYRASACLRIAP